MANPPKRITDPAFRYTSSASTDIRKTFARIRREQRKAAAPKPEPVPITAFPRRSVK